jgi:hypothetical protein
MIAQCGDLCGTMIEFQNDFQTLFDNFLVVFRHLSLLAMDHVITRVLVASACSQPV